MSNEPTNEPTTEDEERREGEFNPSGGVPSHPADPQYGGGTESGDDTTDDDDTPA